MTPETVEPAGSADRGDLGRKLAIGGGAAMMVASFLPWVEATAPLLGTVSQSGVDAGDGYFSLLLGLGIILLATVWQEQDTRIVLGVAAVSLVFALFEWLDVASDIAALDEEFVIASLGFGVPLLVLGAIAAVVGAVLVRQAPRS